ncbi:MAG: hypothetical protein WKF90_06890 [Pyrinomonadaceae bacterium]
MPERTRLFRRLTTHRKLTTRFLTEPTIFGVIDSYGIELCDPIREVRTTTATDRQKMLCLVAVDCRGQILYCGK